MGGSNSPLNPFTNIRKIPKQQQQQPLNMGQYIPNIPYQQPYVGATNVFLLLPPKEASTIKLVGLNLGAPMLWGVIITLVTSPF